eukprot:15440575-Alexandrium_andersonii.AAC.1
MRESRAGGSTRGGNIPAASSPWSTCRTSSSVAGGRRARRSQAGRNARRPRAAGSGRGTPNAVRTRP